MDGITLAPQKDILQGYVRVKLPRLVGFQDIDEDVYILMDVGVIIKDETRLYNDVDYIHTSIAIR